jgi:EAL domain-containing protein (putative c-di-GMP-specific phosphodiesterase class I)
MSASTCRRYGCDRKLVDFVAALLRETRFEPARLVLEVTESVLIDDPERAKAALEDLRKLGVRLALDDFGAGYSSLTYLQRLPFDKLKIDRGFVAALDHSANAGVIIQAIVALGRALGMSIVIEGSRPRSSACCSASPDATRCRGICSHAPARARTSTACCAMGLLAP